MATKENVGTRGIAEAIRKRYPATAYALFFEVGDSTGLACGRHADAICMSLWPSRGLGVAGYEFKASRSDWVKERDTPAKSEAILQYCDEWWLVVSAEGIVLPGELPPTWGLMIVKAGSLKVLTPAPKLTPKTWPKAFLASVLRSAQKPSAAADEIALRNAREAGFRDATEAADRTGRHVEEDLGELREQVRQFELETGLSMTSRFRGISPRDVATAMTSLADRSFAAHVEKLRHAQAAVRRIAEELECEVNAISRLSVVETPERGEV